MGSAETRWERLAFSLFVTGWLFVAFTVYGVYSGDDWRGLVMTVVPGAIVFALWYLARARAEYLLTGTKPPLLVTAISTAIIVVGVGFAIHRAVSAPELVYVTEQEYEQDRMRRALDRMDLSEVEVGEIETTFANGEKGKVKSLVRKRRPSSECEQWTEVPHPNEPGTMISSCARWAPR